MDGDTSQADFHGLHSLGTTLHVCLSPLPAAVFSLAVLEASSSLKTTTSHTTHLHNNSSKLPEYMQRWGLYDVGFDYNVVSVLGEECHCPRLFHLPLTRVCMIPPSCAGSQSTGKSGYKPSITASNHIWI